MLESTRVARTLGLVKNLKIFIHCSQALGEFSRSSTSSSEDKFLIVASADDLSACKQIHGHIPLFNYISFDRQRQQRIFHYSASLRVPEREGFFIFFFFYFQPTNSRFSSYNLKLKFDVD